MPHFVAVSAAGTAAFVWCWFGSPGGPEGLMTLGSLADRVMVAVPIAWVVGILELLLANKLVTLAPKAPPWVVAPQETIDGHYKAAWLVSFAMPFVVVGVFGLLPFSLLSWWLEHKQLWMNETGAGYMGAALASALLVPRLGGAVLRKVDVWVYARARKREGDRDLEALEEA